MLRITTKIYLALVLLSGTAMASATVKEVNQKQAIYLQKIDSVSVSGVRGSLDDAVRALRYKAETKRGRYYQIISLGTSGDSSLWRGVAIIYK